MGNLAGGHSAFQASPLFLTHRGPKLMINDTRTRRRSIMAGPTARVAKKSKSTGASRSGALEMSLPAIRRSRFLGRAEAHTNPSAGRGYHRTWVVIDWSVRDQPSSSGSVVA